VKNLFTFLSLCASIFWATEPAAQDRPWNDENLPDTKRVEALLEAMTTEEKMGQLLFDAPGIPRLGILPYNWWNEALHGVARNGRATIFPQPIGLAATFDEELIHRVAGTISDEARAKFNISQSIGNYSRYAGLTFWSPNVNLFRDPRWGRGMETYGEDPYLQARLGTAFVKGLQGEGQDRLQAAACAKHYVVHSGPEALRHEFDAVAPKRDFYESYLPAFEALVKEGGVECVMCAYNRTYGEPACGSKLLLQDILRDQWGFKGHVVSDCWAINDFYQHHKVAEDAASSAAWALKAGTDLNCGDAFRSLPEALERGLVSEQDIDRALSRLLHTKLKLGFFDSETPWDGLAEDRVQLPGHVELAREAARHSLVLLKNDGVLPLSRDIRTMYVTGPFAGSTEVLLGNYHGLSQELVTVLEGITAKVSAGTTLTYNYGQLPFSENVNPIDWATGNAKEVDAAVVVLGVSPDVEGEEGASVASAYKGDRIELDLPAPQLDFLRKIRADNDRPVIVVLTGGSPIATPEIEELADAILFAWYPGQQGGAAVADVIFGDHNPSGRLPITFPRSTDQLPPYEDYSMAGRTYKYMTEKPWYPFGYGLSFTSFEYAKPELSSASVESGDPLEVTVRVRNTGETDGREIVQLYITSEDAGFDVPQSTLIGFKPVEVAAGGEESVTFTVKPEQMDVFDAEGQRQRIKGRYTLHAGGVSPGERGAELTGAALQSIQFTVK
jgi:beta-glucosidase